MSGGGEEEEKGESGRPASRQRLMRTRKTWRMTLLRKLQTSRPRQTHPKPLHLLHHLPRMRLVRTQMLSHLPLHLSRKSRYNHQLLQGH